MAKKKVIRSIFHGLLSALVTGRRIAAKKVAEAQAPEAADAITAAVLQPLPAALPPPPERQPRLHFHVRSGWSEPKPSSLPQPTYVPAAMAFGIVMVTLGIVTRWFFDVLGAILIITAAVRWVAELLGEGNSTIDEQPVQAEMNE